VLGDNAVNAAYDRDLPDAVLTVIREAGKYAEGKAIRIEIKPKTISRSRRNSSPSNWQTEIPWTPSVRSAQE
jgi:hypothetical protein